MADYGAAHGLSHRGFVAIDSMSNVQPISHWGLTGFLVQRVSSLVLAAYALCLAGFFLFASDLNPEALRAFFGHILMQALSFVALLSFVSHAWVGLWTIGTDYIRPHYFGRFAVLARTIYHGLVLVMLCGQTVCWLLIIIRL